jgi:hypothetical protein
MFALPRPDYSRFKRFRAASEAAETSDRLEALSGFLPQFHGRYNWLISAPGPGHDMRIGAGDAKLASLQVDGFCVWRLDPGLKGRLRELTAAMAATLETRLQAAARVSFNESHVALDPSDHAEIYAAVDEAFAKAGLWPVVSAYAGEAVRLANIAFQVNTAHTTTIKYGRIDDAGLPEHKTNYFHIDSACWPHIKVLIYIVDVGMDQGPFRYVRGSHRWAGAFELAVRKTNDKLKTPPRLFMALPEPFQLQADFGFHMDPGSSEAAALIDAEMPVCGDAGDAIAFDYHGVHRGGFVRRGARYMLQCNFDTVDPDGPASQARRGRKSALPAGHVAAAVGPPSLD